MDRARGGLLALVIALVLVLLLAGTGCDSEQKPPETTTTTPSTSTTTTTMVHAQAVLPLRYVGGPGPKIAFVGDSLTEYASANIQHRFRLGFSINLQYKSGQTTAQMLPALQAQLTNPNGPPDAVVENLGSNDVMLSLGKAWRPAFDRMIAMLTAVPCVVLTTISTDAEVTYRKPPLAREIDAAIADAVAAHPNMHVVDWAAETRGPNREQYWLDGLHESYSHDMSDTTTGAHRIAGLDHQVVTEECGLG